MIMPHVKGHRRALIVLIAVCSAAWAQTEVSNMLSGQLIDAATLRPVRDANVFLANTTVGDAADSSGYYLLRNIPPGNYTLVAAHIGYETRQQHIRITAAERSIYNFMLTPTVIDLPALQVQALRDPEWRRQLARFQKEFLGNSENAAACRLVNPEVMRLHLNGTILLASSAAPLEIVHERFGYRIIVVIKSFQLDGEQTSYTVLPVYRPMTPKNAAQQNEWEAHRRSAFEGSFRHFFYALFYRRLESEGFSLERVDDRRPFSAPPAVYDSHTAVGAVYSDTDFGLFKKLHFKDYLRIRWKNNYAQTSFLDIPFDTLQVDLAGTSMTDAQVIRSGYWGEKRFADELPWDYWPE